MFSGVADLKKVFDEARAPPRKRAGHAAVRRRDPSLQPRAAGQLPAGDGGRHHRAGRRHHRESVVRAQRARCCRARACWCSSRSTRRRSRSCWRAPRRSKASRCRSTTRPRAALVRMADGDGRASLTLAEEVWRAARPGEVFDPAKLQEIVQRRAPIYDKAQDGHYNLISALHKSVRGSDPDAALYYLARMLDAGEHAALHRAPRRAHGDRGYRAGRSAGAGDRQCRQGRLRLPRLAGRRTRHRAGGDLCGDRAEIERRLRRLSAPPCARRQARPARCCRRSTSSMRRPS